MIVAVLSILLTATFTVYVGSLQCATVYAALTKRVRVGSGSATKRSRLSAEILRETEISHSYALLIPVISTVTLLLLFFFFKYAQHVLIGLQIFGGLLGVFCVTYVTFGIANPLQLSNSVINAISLCVAVLTVFGWMATSSILVLDFFACSMCVFMIAFMRFPSLKVAATLLLLLLAYDVFFVFFSEYIFDKNVMMEVATKSADNPLHQLAKNSNWTIFEHIHKSLELPNKIIFLDFSSEEAMMLGTGDIMLPGMLVAYALRCDQDLSEPNEAMQGGVDPESGMSGMRGTCACVPSSVVKSATPLFDAALGSYAVGLVVSMVASIVSGEGQPALLYLVPCVLGTLLGKAWHMGKLKDVWYGPGKLQPST